MKISPRMVNDLLTLIQHTRTNISWGVGGSFNTGEDGQEIDTAAVKSAERAIDFIKTLIMQRE